MAKYKTLPNYEINRPGLHIQFNSEGVCETNDDPEIEALDAVCGQFIERVDKPKAEPAKTKEPAKKK